jgi:hypothetical protein
MPVIKNSLKENIFIYLAISLFSFIPAFQLIFIDNYNQLLIYDNLSFESVYFYLSKSYSLINKFTPFYADFQKEQILLTHDYVPNIIVTFFLLVFKKYALVSLSTLLLFFTTYFFTIFLHKLFLIKKSESLIIALVVLNFMGVGPDSLKTILNYFTFNDLRNSLFLRIYYPMISSILLLFYLFFLNKFYKKKKVFVVIIFSLLNFFTYFYSALIVIMCNFFYSTRFINTKAKFISINLLSIIVLLFYYSLSIYHSNTTSISSLSAQYVLNIPTFDFFLNNFRNNFISICLILFFRFFYKKNKLAISKLLFFHIVLQLITLPELFFYEMQVNMHIGMYFFKALNFITLFYLIFKFLDSFYLNKFYNYMAIFLVSFFLTVHVAYYKKINLIENQNIVSQNLILKDLKKIKEQIFVTRQSDKSIYIDSPYANAVFHSSTENKKKLIHNNFYINNAIIFRSSKIEQKKSVSNFVLTCKIFEIKLDDCYKDFVFNYSNSFFNKSFSYTGDRNFNLNKFELYYTDNNFNAFNYFKNFYYIISQNDLNYNKKIKYFQDSGAVIKKFFILDLAYYN